METVQKPKDNTKAASALDSSTGSRWVWVEREFSQREVFDEIFVSWVWKLVRIGPFTKKLKLRDGEVVRTTPLNNGGMKIEILFREH